MSEENTGDDSLQVTTETTGPVSRALTVEVEPKRVARAFDRAYRDLARRVSIKGFRPGKAPRSVLERLYGRALGEEIERGLVSESLPQAVLQSGIQPVSEPQVDASPPVEGESFRYRVEIEVKPEIALPDLGGLSAQRPGVEVDEEAVEREIESLRERRAPLEDESEGTRVDSGHFVTLDYVGRVDGETFEGGSARDVTLEIGSGRFLPGFEEQLVGASAGDDVELRVSFPEDYGVAELAGKEAVFAVHVSAVKRRELPEVDDAFAKELGPFETVADLRERIREDLRTSRQRESDQTLRRTLMDDVLGRCDFEVPPGMISRRVEQRLHTASQQLAQALPEAELSQRLAAWREEWRPAAEREVREELVLEAVARAEGLEASDDEVSERLDRLARDQGVDPDRLREAYQQRGMLDVLRAQILEERALAHLEAQATVGEPPAEPSEAP